MTQIKTLLAAPVLLALAATSAFADVNQPQEIVDRPRTTPASQITVGGDVSFEKFGDANFSALRVLGLYGVNEKLEVGASYAFALKEFEAKGDVQIHAAYGLVDGNLSAAATLDFGYSLLAEGLDPLALGAEVQFKVNDKLVVYTPGQQLLIGLEEPNAIGLTIPVGIGYQVSPQIFAHVDTNIADIEIKDTGGSAFIGADRTPLAVGAFFSPSNTMDFGATLGFPNLEDAGDFLYVVGSARLHM
jgi:opacity protein-like surface antigen